MVSIASLSATFEDVHRVEEVVRKHRLPSYVSGFEVGFEDTWNGDPGVQVRFWLEKDGARSDDVSREMNALASSVQDDLYRLFSDRSPSVYFIVPPAARPTHLPE